MTISSIRRIEKLKELSHELEEKCACDSGASKNMTTSKESINDIAYWWLIR